MIERQRVPARVAALLVLAAAVLCGGERAGAGAEALTLGPSNLPRGGAAPPRLGGCEAFGPGFQKIAGTDTCVRIGGQVRFETSIVSGGSSVTPRTR